MTSCCELGRKGKHHSVSKYDQSLASLGGTWQILCCAIHLGGRRLALLSRSLPIRLMGALTCPGLGIIYLVIGMIHSGYGLSGDSHLQSFGFKGPSSMLIYLRHSDFYLGALILHFLVSHPHITAILLIFVSQKHSAPPPSSVLIIKVHGTLRRKFYHSASPGKRMVAGSCRLQPLPKVEVRNHRK